MHEDDRIRIRRTRVLIGDVQHRSPNTSQVSHRGFRSGCCGMAWVGGPGWPGLVWPMWLRHVALVRALRREVRVPQGVPSARRRGSITAMCRPRKSLLQVLSLMGGAGLE